MLILILNHWNENSAMLHVAMDCHEGHMLICILNIEYTLNYIGWQKTRLIQIL